MYHVKHHAYCGMAGLLHSFDTEAEARDYASARLRGYRQEYAVTTLEIGKEWEILEPDDCAMVPDDCGTLSLWRETFECKECGSLHDTKEEAYACCSETDWPDVDEEAEAEAIEEEEALNDD